MSIKDWADEGLINLENNYRSKGLTEGGKFSLAEVLLEIKRRNSGPWDTQKVVNFICKASSASSDGLLTYGEIWSHFHPDKPWVGQYNLKIVGKALGGVIYHCVQNDTPILTVLVVQAQKRALGEKAKENIYNECKELGVDVGLDPHIFAASQVSAAKSFATLKVS